MAGGEQTQPILQRHPELVSGPILRFARRKRWQAQANRQIRPVRIAIVDQIDFPLPVPTLELFLACNGELHCTEQLETDEKMDAVFGSETGNSVIAVLPEATGQVGSDADVKRAVGLAGEDVDARLALFPHAPEFAAKWVLKQVQDDEFCRVGVCD